MLEDKVVLWAVFRFVQEGKQMKRKTTQSSLLIFFVMFVILGCMMRKVEARSQNHFLVELGEEFEIKKEQTVSVVGTNFQLEILAFFNQPCPPYVNCLWSGVGIEFEYRSDGLLRRGINVMEAFGYKITVIKTDYESFAILRITKG